MVMSWNGYPTFKHNSFIKRLSNSPREVLKKEDTKKKKKKKNHE